MSNSLGVIARGIKCPIIKKGDDIIEVVVNSIVRVVEENNIQLQDRDIIGVTESVVARAQGNYATTDQIATDVRNKFGSERITLVNPIYSRNRFAICLKGIAKAVKEVRFFFNPIRDEVGNLSIHPITGVDYHKYYKEIVESVGAEYVETTDLFSSQNINILICDIHTEKEARERLKFFSNAKTVYSLSQILSASIDGSGFNIKYGLLGSNKVDEDTVKLFPRDCNTIVDAIQSRLQDIYHKNIEVMIYGDGAFKDPDTGIWELADPVVSPGYTIGLEGSPNEIKLKYLADDKFKNLSGEELREAIVKSIKEKDSDLKGKMISQGTTPRRYVNLLGSLCDLVSGSGDKGTPVILIQNYFKNYAD